MTDFVKYPKTMHLHFSPGLQNDDRVMPLNLLDREEEVVVTEKMDGENTTMYRNNIHARSIDSRYHPSRDWVKGFWASNVCFQIPLEHRICGENMYAQHSIAYTELASYFYGFSYWNGDTCYSWDDTVYRLEFHGITPVPVLGRGKYSQEAIHQIVRDLDLERQEGVVVRPARAFDISEFPCVVGKWVRPDHVKTNDHWMHQEMKVNGLSS